LLWAGFEHGAPTGLEGRFGGILGTASFGLVSGLLVLYAVIKRDDKSRQPAMWIGSFIVGLFGLFLAKSAISIFAVAGAVSVYFATMRFRRSKMEGLLRGAAVGTILMIAAALVVSNVRQGDVSELGNVSGGSFAERLMFGYAGLQIFLDHPVIGVGWQASTAAAVIDTPALREVLKEKFSHLPASYFLKPPSQIHNMYIQFLAELGIIGFTLFVWVCCRMGKRITRILKNLPTESPYRGWAQFDALALIFLLIWWNGNPLFGGQTESILAFAFLGMLASIWELEKRRVGQYQ
jgi:O-antigen ligase